MLKLYIPCDSVARAVAAAATVELDAGEGVGVHADTNGALSEAGLVVQQQALGPLGALALGGARRASANERSPVPAPRSSATSLAAVKTPPAAPRTAITSRQMRKAGKRFRSGAAKVRLPICARSRRATGSVLRSG